MKDKSSKIKKATSEKCLIEIIEDMCIESLGSQHYKKWKEVEEALIHNRKTLS